MPTDPTRTLSERLETYRRCLISERGMTSDEGKLFNELARLCERFEQPEVAELLAKADDAEEEGSAYHAEDLRGYAHALARVGELEGELAEVREKLGRVEGLRDEFLSAGSIDREGRPFAIARRTCGRELDAAISGAGGESEVRDA